MPDKILLFCGGSYVSGLEIVTLHLIKGLKEKGYEVRCICNGWNDGNFKKRLEEIGIPYYEIKIGWIYIRNPLWTLDSLANYPRAYFACKKAIKEYNPDIFQFCGFGPPIMLYSLIGQKALYGLHETHHPSLKHRVIYRLLNKKIKYFTAVSNHIVNVLKKLDIPPHKIELIYNGIPPVPLREINHNTQLEKNAVQFAVIGQVVLWKGHLVLLEAVERLIGNGISNFKILVYGNDSTPFATELKNLLFKKGVAEYFKWKGFVADQEVVYSECDVVIVPSLSAEPCSLTIVESMCRGKAVIVSDRGGNPELVQDKINGLMFNAIKPLELSNCMEFLINNRAAIIAFGEAARQKADQHFSYLNMTESYIALYNKL